MSQDSSSTTSTALRPTRSESRAKRARPLRTNTSLTVQPGGFSSTQGSWLAVGTAWAMRTTRAVPCRPW